MGDISVLSPRLRGDMLSRLPDSVVESYLVTRQAIRVRLRTIRRDIAALQAGVDHAVDRHGRHSRQALRLANRVADLYEEEANLAAKLVELETGGFAFDRVSACRLRAAS